MKLDVKMVSGAHITIRQAAKQTENPQPNNIKNGEVQQLVFVLNINIDKFFQNFKRL